MRLIVLTILLTAIAAAAPEGDERLAIEHIALHQSEDGPPVPASFAFLPGDTVYFSCQLSGYKKTSKEFGVWEIFLTYAAEARDSKGLLLAPADDGKIATTVTQEDKAWMPIVRFAVAVPGFAESGRYEIFVTAKDQFTGELTQARTSFTVAGKDVPPSQQLVVRNFHFFRGEQDKDPLEAAAYRPGEMVWARFDMTGYKLGEKNRFEVEYGLQVLRPNGEVSFAQPHAADEKNESFYPQRYTPGVLSLTLPKDIRPGKYTIVLSVRDVLGAQTYERREQFSIE